MIKVNTELFTALNSVREIYSPLYKGADFFEIVLRKSENGKFLGERNILNYFDSEMLFELLSGGYEEENPVLNEVHALIDRQTEKGVKKYGHAVDYNEHDALVWINHAKEEVADLLVYLTCLEQKIKSR